MYLEGLQRLFDTWGIIARNSNRINKEMEEKINFDDLTEVIVCTFMRTILSEPLGSRVQVIPSFVINTNFSFSYQDPDY